MIWLNKTKVWWKSVTVLYWYRHCFIVHVKADDIYKDIAEDVETKFHTSNFEMDRWLPKGKNERVIGIMKDELSGQIMKEFFGLRAKTYSYLKDNNDEDKKEKGTKRCVIKRKLKFQDYENCLKAVQIGNKKSYLEKIKLMEIVLKKIKKVIKILKILKTNNKNTAKI